MDTKTKSDLQSIRMAAISKKRTCMYSGCHDRAIKSHVLQKNGILRQMSEDNHLVEMRATSIIELEEKGMFSFRSVGVNESYTFNGFCNKHDSLIFAQIENDNLLDFYKPLHQCLFSYRGLCQEIRRKEVSIEWISEVSLKLDPVSQLQFASLIDGYKSGVKNLNFFKKEMEKAIDSGDLSSFNFTTVKLPKIELCISVPLNVNELEDSNPHNLPYEAWKDSLSFPFTTSFINLFPYKKDSYFISGYHTDFPCGWTKRVTNKLSYLKNKKLKKELSDFVVLRLEFWAMSPSLFKKIPAKTIEKFKHIFSKNVMNHSAKMKTDINLFETV
ncbi:hypothetical protein Q3A66_09015 [Hymenobacter sp. BT770]|uniref:hypothetical protein n=1 Tax=Hymenobacter sp. BT770 TaxID=2886942 RepID=UPI001D11BDD3|nr:hypothetical protein [Hymenobacter sp. BT770]MCC3152110.1 hypothetical protein [Hymenobacter sp. BT770]MDO3415207.1 hypothetical protein [Hymenobacter sp. BT770]